MLRIRHIIDSHKFLTPVVLVIAIVRTGQWDSHTAWLYTSLHGTYAWMWLIKSAVYPDKSWEAPGGAGPFMVVYGLLTPYIVTAMYMMSKRLEAPVWTLPVAVFMWAMGCLFHYASDMQKYMSLKLKPGLITENFFAMSRNPNYFGECLIYLSFLLVESAAFKSYWPFLIFVPHFLFLYSGMANKDKSLSRYPTFAAYKKRTSFLVPYLW